MFCVVSRFTHLLLSYLQLQTFNYSAKLHAVLLCEKVLREFSANMEQIETAANVSPQIDSEINDEVNFDNDQLSNQKRMKLVTKLVTILKFIIIGDLFIELLIFIINLLISWSEINYQITNYYRAQELGLILIAIMIALIEMYGVYKEILLIVLVTAITWTFGVILGIYLICVSNSISRELNTWLIDFPMTLISILYLILLKQRQDAIKKEIPVTDANYNVNPFAYQNF